ncbi:MAG: ATP-binding protein [Bacteroidetes bacterium 4572_77]|nr:MAG: ATP-binding protein [Bacteroidetes bacterium 4572_77]
MLKIRINSFSFIYGGLPKDNSGHGGGHIFDCRALPNPGRYEQYKQLTGMDEEVIAYLENEEEVKEFLKHVFALADISVGKYLSRNFDYLSISFGCTGGQHRSVYAAEQLSQYIAENYEDVIIELRHIAREEAAKNQSK